jgi:hypothetical protein
MNLWLVALAPPQTQSTADTSVSRIECFGTTAYSFRNTLLHYSVQTNKRPANNKQYVGGVDINGILTSY